MGNAEHHHSGLRWSTSSARGIFADNQAKLSRQSGKTNRKFTTRSDSLRIAKVDDPGNLTQFRLVVARITMTTRLTMPTIGLNVARKWTRPPTGVGDAV